MSTKKKTAPRTRAELAEAIRALGNEMASLEALDLRLAAAVLRGLAMPVRSFDDKDCANQRADHIQAMTDSLKALARNWNPGSKWWLCAVERAELEAEWTGMGRVVMP
jgi:hypothetical protein